MSDICVTCDHDGYVQFSTNLTQKRLSYQNGRLNFMSLRPPVVHSHNSPSYDSSNIPIYEIYSWMMVINICVIISSNDGLSPGHHLNQCWNIVDWNKLQWNFNRNPKSFVQENAIESVVCEMAAILSRPQCVKWITPVGHSWSEHQAQINWKYLCHSVQ